MAAMNEQELRARLRIARPENGAHEIPELADALHRANSDPEWQKIVAAERAFDDRFATQLKAGLPVPADLQARLLALAPSAAETPIPFPTLRRTAPWLSPRVTWLAVAAAVFVAGLLFLRQPPTAPSEPGAAPLAQLTADPLNGLVQAVAQRLTNLPDYDHRGSQLEDLKTYLVGHSLPSPTRMPAALGQMPTEGCVTFEVDGIPVTMITFQGDRAYRMFTINRSDLPSCPERLKPVIEKVAGHTVGVWTCRYSLYFVTCEGGEQTLANLF